MASVSRCKGHQKGSTDVSQGKQTADQAAKRAALQNHDLVGVGTLVPQTNLPETPSYTEGETLKAASEGFQEDHMSWFQKEGLLFLPGTLKWKLVNFLLATTHLGEKVLQKLLERSFRVTDFQTIKQPPRNSKTSAGQPIQWCETYPGEDWQVDFTQIPVSQVYQYLLIMINTFSWWVGGFPTLTEKVEEVVKKKKLLHEIILRFDLLWSSQSDNGISFTSMVTQRVSKALGIT